MGVTPSSIPDEPGICPSLTAKLISSETCLTQLIKKSCLFDIKTRFFKRNFELTKTEVLKAGAQFVKFMFSNLYSFCHFHFETAPARIFVTFPLLFAREARDDRRNVSRD